MAINYSFLIFFYQFYGINIILSIIFYQLYYFIYIYELLAFNYFKIRVIIKFINQINNADRLNIGQDHNNIYLIFRVIIQLKSTINNRAIKCEKVEKLI